MSPQRWTGRLQPFGAETVPGLAMLFTGAVLCTVSFAVLPWYSVSGAADSAGRGFGFSDLRTNADALVVPVASAYFDRFAWGLVGVVVVLALAARVAESGTAALRCAAFLAAAAGLILTFYALAQLFDAQRAAGGSAHSVLHNATWGLYITLLGWVLLAAGAVAGFPRSATIT